MIKKITIICVGYNESVNLPKFFAAIESCKSILDITIHYIDQSSTDDSIDIVSQYTPNIYQHINRGYADPDKKWAVENLISDDELCMILDADEEITRELAQEIGNTDIQVANICIPVYFLGAKVHSPIQSRIFMKEYINITDTIHDYIKIKDPTMVKMMKSILINVDNKNIGNEIGVMISKTLKYAENEIRNDNKYMTIIKMILMPLIWFFGYWIYHKNIFRGMPGFIISILMGWYQFMIYAKHYEKTIHSK